MSEGVLVEAEKRVERAIMELLAYYAVFGLSVREAEINSYIGLRTGHLAIRGTLQDLVERGVVGQDEDDCFRLGEGFEHSYHRRAIMEKRQARFMAKARWWGRIIGLLPFVKAVVVTDSVARGDVRADSDIDLLIVTKPNRIYLTKGILRLKLKFLRQLKTVEHRAERFGMDVFITTAGVNWLRDGMTEPSPHLVYWLMLAKPVYGAPMWYDLLKSSPIVTEKMPNYVWPKSDIRVYSSGLEWLDQLDNKGYRRHLRHTASQLEMHTSQAFTRVRPDIISLHPHDQSVKIARKYQRIINSIDKYRSAC